MIVKRTKLFVNWKQASKGLTQAGKEALAGERKNRAITLLQNKKASQAVANLNYGKGTKEALVARNKDYDKLLKQSDALGKLDRAAVEAEHGVTKTHKIKEKLKGMFKS